VPGDTAATARFAELAAQAPGAIAVERSTLGLPAVWAKPLGAAAELGAATFERRLDWRWRRTSYSDITAGAYEPWVTSEPEETVVTDEPEEPVPVHMPAAADADAPEDAALAVPSLLGAMPMGVRVGTLVHRVLEATDFAAADLDAELTAQIAAAQARRHVEIGDPAVVVAGLRAAVETPLGPLLGGLRLRDLARADRLDELDFELPLAGGDDPTGELALSAIGGVLRDHLDDDDPLAAYALRLDDPALRRTVRGYLTGSLDLVARVPDSDGVPRFAVLDYKTNWLGPPEAELTAWHHRPSALAAEIRRAHYGLQALLYTAALHRYLRWRLPGYDPARNLAGVLYLFLRGMTGPDTPTVDGAPCGVFAWRPPGALVEALSDVLDGAGVAR
jgi:exodeoxyribonuclease V beta subunit